MSEKLKFSRDIAIETGSISAEKLQPMRLTSFRFKVTLGSILLSCLLVVAGGIGLWWLATWGVCDLQSSRPVVRSLRALSKASATVAPAPTVPATVSPAWSVEQINEARTQLQEGTDEEALLAIRRLGSMECWASVQLLAGVAGDPQWPEDLRIEAVQALRTLHTSSSASALKQLYGKADSVALQVEIVTALGNEDYFEIAPLFERILNAKDSPSDLRVATAEALAYSSPEALPTLRSLAAVDADADVRSAAAWAMSCIRSEQPYGKELAAMAKKEPEVMVRRRLYEALLMQADNTAVSLVPVISAETDLAARVAGLNALGDSVSRSMNADWASEFDARQVPDLKRIALSNETTNLRMRAVFALRRAGTPASMQALREITQSADEPHVARAAYNGSQPYGS